MIFLLGIVQGILESIGMVSFAMVLARLAIDWKQVIFYGTVQALIVVGVRSLHLFFGLHTLIGIIVMVVLLSRVFNLNTISAFLSTTVATLVLCIVETSLTVGITLVTGRPEPIVSSLEWVVEGMPLGIIMILLALAGSYWQKRRKDAMKTELSELEQENSGFSGPTF